MYVSTYTGMCRAPPEADAILQDVAQRRRRVFGPAHPDTRFAEDRLSRMRAFFARLRFA